MLYTPKIDDCLEILTDKEVKDFVAKTFGEYFKSTREEQNISKVAKSLYIFLTIPNEVETHVQSISSDNIVYMVIIMRF